MLEKFLSDPAAVELRRTGLFGRHLDSFVATVSQLGYARASVQCQLRTLADLEQWLQRKKLAVADLDERLATQFLEKQRRKGRLRRGDARTVHHFLEHLREESAG